MIPWEATSSLPAQAQLLSGKVACEVSLHYMKKEKCSLDREKKKKIKNQNPKPPKPKERKE